jgi:hypothetical protein
VSAHEWPARAARIVVGRRERVQIDIEPDRIRVFGGSLREATAATPTPEEGEE